MHVASVTVFVQQMSVALLKYLLCCHLRTRRTGVQYGSGKYRIKIYHFVRLRDYPAIDGARPGFIGRAVILDGLPHHVYLLLCKPLPKPYILLQHPAGRQMMVLTSFAHTYVMIRGYGVDHIRIQLIAAAAVHLTGRQLSENLHTLVNNRLYVPA